MYASDVLQSSEACGLSFLVGVALHLYVFRFGEWDLSAQRIITNFTLAYAATIGVTMALPSFMSMISRTSLEATSLTQVSKAAIILFSSLTAGIYASILIYRGLFHRLHRFPGPFLAKFTNLYVTFKIWNRMHLHEDVRKLHEKYGDVVRIGPTELSINKSGAIDAVFLDTDCMKGPWYNLLHPMVSMQMVRDKEAHSRRRKAWEYGFTSKCKLS